MPPPVPKEGPGPVPKDKHAKKCKTAKMPPPKADGVRYLIVEEPPPPMEPPMDEEEYCLHGDVTEEECQAARTGKLPKDHQKIQGDVSLDISYGNLPASDVLEEMTGILRSQTAAAFIGCGDAMRRRVLDDANLTTHAHPMGPPNDMDDDLQVTGVDFTEPQIIMTAAECPGGMNETSCDTISSRVHIYFSGSSSDADQTEMFALLIATIQEQARDGAFRDVATVERVALTSSISDDASGGDNDATTAQTVGIPTGVVGGVLLIAAVALLGYCFLCRGRDDEDNDHLKEDDIIVAEAIVVENDAEEEDMYHKKKSKTRFL